MGGVKVNRKYGRCFLCRYVVELCKDGTVQNHKLYGPSPRGEWCRGGLRLPHGNGESYVTRQYSVKPDRRKAMDFGFALAMLRKGERVGRFSWAREDQGWLILVPGSTITVDAHRPLGRAAPNMVGQEISYLPHIDLYTTSGMVPWVPTQDDLLADDWSVW